MAANLYARSIFGEDVLANLSIEKPGLLNPGAAEGAPDTPVVGHVRIRAKTQVSVSIMTSLAYVTVFLAEFKLTP